MSIEQGEIKVSRKTLLHVSEGIYRSVGSALKELVNNAFDANANTVRINTNFSQFDFLSIQDDGDGMPLNEFKRIVEGGIGDSKKATSDDGARPLIGKLGIGILAVAQVCRSFTVISHHPESKTAFKGQMIFNPSVDEVVKTTEIKNDYPAGMWKILDIPHYNPTKKGVLIYTDDLRPAYLKRFRKDPNTKNHAPLKFEEYFENILENNLVPGWYKSIKELGPYHELIYELCALLPIKYYEVGPIRKRNLENVDQVDVNTAVQFLKKKQKQLTDFNFSVILDNMNLYKPIRLPFPELRYGQNQECQLFFLKYDNLVRNRRLHFKVYLFAQEFAIYPRELNGLQIRIKNVGIGLHDQSFLGYDKVESPRDKWVTGEVYVEAGLESALNIDRDSFNENDEHFFVLRREIHNKLRVDVFPYIRRIQTERNNVKRAAKGEVFAKEMKKGIITCISNHIPEARIKITGNIDEIEASVYTKEIRFPKSITDTKLKVRRDIYLDSLFELLSFMEGLLKNKKEAKKVLIELTKIVLS